MNRTLKSFKGQLTKTPNSLRAKFAMVFSGFHRSFYQALWKSQSIWHEYLYWFGPLPFVKKLVLIIPV